MIDSIEVKLTNARQGEKLIHSLTLATINATSYRSDDRLMITRGDYVYGPDDGRSFHLFRWQGFIEVMTPPRSNDWTDVRACFGRSVSLHRFLPLLLDQLVALDPHLPITKLGAEWGRTMNQKTYRYTDDELRDADAVTWNTVGALLHRVKEIDAAGGSYGTKAGLYRKILAQLKGRNLFSEELTVLLAEEMANRIADPTGTYA